MNVVDSSAWLEYFADGPNARTFAGAIEAADELIVPSVVVYEVFKRVRQQRDEEAALTAVAGLREGTLVELSETLALAAARTSAELGLPLADAVILATAREAGATLWTQDADFAGIEGVEYVAK